tara:strand:- start:1426 stop:2046 length:621 start_codon:yes stop_codon:yes gene_type:complete
MGFLDNSTVTVDAILTKRGRQILSQGGNFQITKFALSDEEIDYTLFDVTHPNGTDSYGSVIENMNLLEAVPNRQTFNSFLVRNSLAGNSIRISNLTNSNVEKLTPIPINPSTDIQETFTFRISNTNIVKFESVPAKKTLVGESAVLVAQSISENATAVVSVEGNTSGLKNIVSIQVKKDEGSTISPDSPEVVETTTSSNGGTSYSG